MVDLCVPPRLLKRLDISPFSSGKRCDVEGLIRVSESGHGHYCCTDLDPGKI